MAKRIQLIDSSSDNVYPVTPCLAGITIPDNSDLNNYKTPGIYYCTSSTRAGTLSNCPTLTAFVMLVLTKGSTVQQIIWAVTTMYSRAESSGGFNRWYSYAGT